MDIVWNRHDKEAFFLFFYILRPSFQMIRVLNIKKRSSLQTDKAKGLSEFMAGYRAGGPAIGHAMVHINQVTS